MLQRIKHFLIQYSTHKELDASFVLMHMPDDWLLTQPEVFNFISSSLSNTNFQNKNMRCKRQLSELDLQNASFNLSKSQKAWIRITERDKCVICNRKVGDKVFDVYPNGVFVDHTCMNKHSPHICPVTG